MFQNSLLFCLISCHVLFLSLSCDSLSELESQLDGKEQRVIDDRVHVLNKKLTGREGHIDELEVKLVWFIIFISKFIER